MSKFLIVLSDDRSAGRGVRGMALAWFLRTFHGRAAVRVVTPNELSQRRPRAAEYVFIGLPSTLAARQATGLRFREAILFDYHDYPSPMWADSDQTFLRSLTNRYWKPWVEHDWSSELRWGCLPIRRCRKLQACLKWGQLAGGAVQPVEKHFDYGFLGTPNGLRCSSAADTESYNQRVEWLLELKRELPDAACWGGLAIPPHLRGWEKQHPYISSVEFPRGRVGFFRYFQSLRKCRVALAPAGNARWSYRQYEAIYARAAVVSTDFSCARMLIPFPERSVVMVPDHTPVTPFVRRALSLQRDEPDAIQNAVRHLEYYLQDGMYTRRKPMVMDRLLQQLDDDQEHSLRVAG